MGGRVSEFLSGVWKIISFDIVYIILSFLGIMKINNFVTSVNNNAQGCDQIIGNINQKVIKRGLRSA